MTREPNPNWRPIAHTAPKQQKKQTTITSLAKVVSLSDVQSKADDLSHLRDLYDSGVPLSSVVKPGPGESRQLLVATKRTKRKQARTELEMSDLESEETEETEESSISMSSSTSSLTPTTATTSPTKDHRLALEQRILTILKSLQALHIALETLEETGVGKTVQRLTKATKKNKRYFPPTIVTAAKQLIEKWRSTAAEGLDRRKRRKASGVDDVVVPQHKKARLDYHFNNRKQRRR